MSEAMKPLAGLRVLELGQLLAGPFTGALLAYFGAEVIKVEPPEGDPIRGWRKLDEGGTSYWWRSLGRNKKCITVDLKHARGQDVVRRLAERSDVLVENFSPGVLERWGLAPETLKAANPRLVIARISGYGQDGPYAAKPGFASVCEGISGFRYLNGFPGEAPVRPNLSIGDTIAALHAALGILIALPIGLAAARNLMPAFVSWPARAIVSLARALHPVIVAILFVKAVGFGALAGILALAVASVGFIGKLFTEAIEEISLKQVEAVRATGASFASVLAFGVLPQVFSRFIGFSTYQLDSNLRNSTMVGIVGAGGIGGTLFAAFQRFDYDFVCAILIAIISLIMIGEILATGVRAIFIDGATFGDLLRRRRHVARGPAPVLEDD